VVKEKKKPQNVTPLYRAWHTPVIPAPGRLRQKTGEFKDNLSYTARPFLKV
jgi:hypothetical protein